MKQKFNVHSLISLALFALCALSMLLCVLFCADRYAKLTNSGNDAFDSRTAAMFFSTKVRQYDVKGSLSLEKIGQCEALAFTEELDGESYVSYIYCHDGYLKELFSLDGIDHLPEDGENLFKMDGLSFSLDGRKLKVIYTSNGKSGEILLTVRSDREG